MSVVGTTSSYVSPYNSSVYHSRPSTGASSVFTRLLPRWRVLFLSGVLVSVFGAANLDSLGAETKDHSKTGKRYADAGKKSGGMAKTSSGRKKTKAAANTGGAESNKPNAPFAETKPGLSDATPLEAPAPSQPPENSTAETGTAVLSPAEVAPATAGSAELGVPTSPAAQPSAESPQPADAATSSPEAAADPAASVPIETSIQPTADPVPPTPPEGSVENAPQLMPDGIESMVPTLPPAGTELPAGPDATATVASPDPEKVKYKITRFRFQYGQQNPKLPPISEISNPEVELGVLNGQLTPPGEGKTKVKIRPAEQKLRTYRADSLVTVSEGVVAELNKRGIYGVYVIPDEHQIDPTTLEDKRGKKDKELNILIYASEVNEVRTIGRRIPFRTTDKPKINAPEHARIREKSPIFAASAVNGSGSLLEKQRLQDYLSRVNRFPGRRVDAAINASGTPGKVILDYLVREQKPWSIYAQIGNTGTESTGEWRTRVGAEIKQLLNLDDTLRVEYATSDFSDYQSALFSYEITPIFPDYLKTRAYFAWGRYSAEDLGVVATRFEGETFTTGLSATWTPLYFRGFPLDITLGVEWQNISVSSEVSFADLIDKTGGGTNFLLPYIGIGTDRITDKYTVAASLELQVSAPGVVGTDSGDDLAVLGRPNVDRYFSIGKLNLLYSFFIEPLLFGKDWEEQKVWWKSTRAHEVYTSFRGQAAFDTARLVPQLQFVVGGFNTVRGYPESFVVGDSGFAGTAEYRLHIPRLF